ncbi:uncharacterized protein [Triticum aestivum]|uniref:uncharacterized protein n=1 Tax=Triticum aestivum TaxID=4565 RepID=UPI000842AF6C|nr:uncharacterized protein LOC123116456 [Triticum aestivum]
MASSADESLPSLPPIKTAPSRPSDAASASPSPASSTQESAAAEDKTTKAAAAEQEEKAPSTPTSKECRILLPEECPAAPRKPPVPRLPALKRKSRPTLTATTTARVCLTVPRDLSTVFRSMPMPVPAEKRIRAS